MRLLERWKVTWPERTAFLFSHRSPPPRLTHPRQFPSSPVAVAVRPRVAGYLDASPAQMAEAPRKTGYYPRVNVTAR